jgi:hypothetical protein
MYREHILRLQDNFMVNIKYRLFRCVKQMFRTGVNCSRVNINNYVSSFLLSSSLLASMIRMRMKSRAAWDCARSPLRNSNDVQNAFPRRSAYQRTRARDDIERSDGAIRLGIIADNKEFMLMPRRAAISPLRTRASGIPSPFVKYRSSLPGITSDSLSSIKICAPTLAYL